MRLTDKQIQIMIDMQKAMNDKVDPDWMSHSHHDWLLAASQEAGEAIDHLGWKWWRTQVPNLAQARMELVDIWHFLISWAIESNQADFLFSFNLTEFPDQEHTKAISELRFFQKECAFPSDVFTSFANCMGLLGLTQQDLFKKYIGKNTLNFFRQDNGYKDGSYEKIWQGLEDNEVLEEILKETDMEAPDVVEQITNQLQGRYQEHWEESV